MADPDWGTVEPLPPKSAKGRRWPIRVLQVIGVLAIAAIVAVTAVVVIGYQTTKQPDANAAFKTQTSFVYYNDGKTELGSFAIQNRQPLTFDQIPEVAKQAVVAAENRSFWTDQGISIRGLLRSAWVIVRGGSIQGGSTITQQYIKVMYLNSEQTVSRKFKELFLAYKINKQMSKEQILTDYLNTIYFGRGAYGIQAASQAYFGVDAKKLTVPQAAVLASVLNNPSSYDPSVDSDNIPRLQTRYAYVLQSMAETGAISPAQATTYAQKLPKFPDIPVNQRYAGPQGFLLKMVERELSSAGFDSSQVSGGGLKIVTTFDKQDEDAAIASAHKYSEMSAGAAGQKASKLHAAIASVKVGTGDVLALYGGSDYIKNSRNWATTPRPTASTFKTYAVAAGLKDGFSLRSVLNGNTFTPPGDSTPVRNEYSDQYGPVSLLKATADSINTAFVDLTTSMSGGPQKILSMAQSAGVPKGAGWTANSRVPLGTAEVSPLNQASGYATFANDGTSAAPHVVKEVRDASGRLIYQAHPNEQRAVSQDIAHDVTYALENVVEQGTGRTVQTLNVPVAGKTGTKDIGNDISSAWFVAYTKQISTAVMYVAGDSGNEGLDKYRRPGDSTFFGGTYPALTWADYMQTAVNGLPVKQFDPPAWVNADSAPQATLPAQSAPSTTPTTSAAPQSTTSSTPSAPATPSRPPSSQSTPGASTTSSGKSTGPGPKTGGNQAAQSGKSSGTGPKTGGNQAAQPGTTSGTG